MITNKYLTKEINNAIKKIINWKLVFSKKNRKKLAFLNLYKCLLKIKGIL